MDEILRIDLQDHLHSSITFLAALAYPEEAARKVKAIIAMKSYCARLYRYHNKPPPLCVVDFATDVAVRDMESSLSKLHNKLASRLLIACDAITLIHEFHHVYETVPIPADEQTEVRRRLIFTYGYTTDFANKHTAKTKSLSRPFSLNELARHSRFSPGKYKDTHWKAALPVLHLAIALRMSLMVRKKKNLDLVVLLLESRDWIGKVIESSENYREVLMNPEIAIPLRRFAKVHKIRLLPL